MGARRSGTRLESIAQSVNVAERLRKARISFVATNYDVANAHPSPSHASLSEALVDTIQDDTGLLRQHHGLAAMEIQGADETHPDPTRVRHSPRQQGSSGCLPQGVTPTC